MTVDLKLGEEILFLSDADIRSIGITAEEVNESVEAVFRAKGEGRTAMRPKLSVNLPGNQQFQAKAGVSQDPPYAAVKWVCPTPANDKKGIPLYRPIILLNDAETGLPLAMLDGMWVTGVRTAAMTTIAAKYLADPESESLGLLTGGLQAYTHLDQMAAMFPSLRKVLCGSRTRATAERFAEYARSKGFEVEMPENREDIAYGVGILASTIPHGKGDPPFLDCAKLREGSFVGMVDLGNTFFPETFGAIDKMVTDDVEQSAPGGPEPLPWTLPFYGEIGDLCAGTKRGRESDKERNGVIFSGIGLGDVGPSALAFERARARGIGQVLTL